MQADTALTAQLDALDIEEYIERGRIAADSIDQGRWVIGEDALDIKSKYGDKTIERYAKAINVRVGRVREYRQVCEYYEYSARTKYLADNPMLSYSHLRDAMRYKDVAKSYEFLDKAAQECMTVERASVEIGKALGKPVPPIRETFEVQAVRQAGNGMVLFAVREADLVRACITDHPDATVKVVVTYAAPVTA